MNDENKVRSIAEYLANEWYAAEDWGDDEFTQVMCRECNDQESDLKKQMFEATCYFAAQQLIYNQSFLEELEKIKNGEE